MQGGRQEASIFLYINMVINIIKKNKAEKGACD